MDRRKFIKNSTNAIMGGLAIVIGGKSVLASAKSDHELVSIDDLKMTFLEIEKMDDKVKKVFMGTDAYESIPSECFNHDKTKLWGAFVYVSKAEGTNKILAVGHNPDHFQSLVKVWIDGRLQYYMTASRVLSFTQTKSLNPLPGGKSLKYPVAWYS